MRFRPGVSPMLRRLAGCRRRGEHRWQPEVLARPRPFVLRADQPSALQFGDDLGDEHVDRLRQDRPTIANPSAVPASNHRCISSATRWGVPVTTHCIFASPPTYERRATSAMLSPSSRAILVNNVAWLTLADLTTGNSANGKGPFGSCPVRSNSSRPLRCRTVSAPSR